MPRANETIFQISCIVTWIYVFMYVSLWLLHSSYYECGVLHTAVICTYAHMLLSLPTPISMPCFRHPNASTYPRLNIRKANAPTWLLSLSALICLSPPTHISMPCLCHPNASTYPRLDIAILNISAICVYDIQLYACMTYQKYACMTNIHI